MSRRGTALSTSPVAAVQLVAGRELNTRLRNKSFTISTVVILAALIGFFLLQSTLFSGIGHSTVGLSGKTTTMAKPLRENAARLGAEVDTRTVSDAAEGKRLVADGELDAFVSGSVADPNVVVQSDLDDQVRAAITGVTRSRALHGELADLGADPAKVLQRVNQASIDVEVLEPPDPAAAQREVIGMIIVALMFLSIMTYGSLVTQGIVEEKSSRVVEILLSTVRPWQLMLGKVLGLGLVGLIQLAIVGVVGIVAASATGILTVSGTAAGMLAWGLLWYVLGFFTYATIFAAAGSLVSRQEEVQSVITPVMMVLMVGYVLGINLTLANPHGTVTAWLSAIPVFSPVMMPGRIAVGAATGWQLALAILLTIGAIALFTWIGGTIYRRAILHTGSRMKLREALQA